MEAPEKILEELEARLQTALEKLEPTIGEQEKVLRGSC
jgi:predicted DNA-binding transcriptional regulator